MNSHRSEKVFTQPTEKDSVALSLRHQASRLDGIKKLKLQTDRLRLIQKMKLESEVNTQRSALLMLNDQIEEQKYRHKMENRARILENIEAMKAQAQIRDKMQVYSNKEVERLKLLKELHDLENQQKVKEERIKKIEQEKKILDDKKKLLRPLPFAQIKKHEEEYMERKMKLSPTKLNPERSLPKLYQYKPSFKTKAAKLAEEEYKQMRHMSERKRSTLLKKLQKRIQYGENAEKQFKRNKIKTQPSRFEEMEKQRLRAQSKRIDQQLKQQKKKKMKFIEGDVVETTKKQISHIKENSNLSFFEKFEVLNNLSKGFIEKFDNGKEYGVEIAAQANLALADLYLTQQL